MKNGWSILMMLVLSLASSVGVYAQNDPYSQRGLGNPIYGHNILNTAMGGISEAYADGQTINFSNPASYGRLQLTTFDVGFNMGYLNIRNQDTSSFRSGLGSLSYLLLGVPLKKGGGWGLVFGLTPETKVNYRVAKSDTIQSIGAPVSYLYKGTGGAYKGFVGTGYEIKGFRFGVNFGYLFGSRQLNTQDVYADDSMNLFNAHIRERTGYGAFFWDGGIQTHLKLGKGMGLELGVSGGLKRTLNAKRDKLVETFFFSGDPSDQSSKNQDTAFYQSGEKGKITYPAHYGAGILFQSSKGKGSWSVGADYHATQWSDYTYYGSTDLLRDSRSFHIGAQFVPSNGSTVTNNYWQMVAYRLGFYTAQKNFESNGSGVSEYAFSVGFGFPIRNYTRASNQYTLINTALEIGKRGNKSNLLNANFIRFSVGFTFSDIWFIDNRYH